MSGLNRNLSNTYTFSNTTRLFRNNKIIQSASLSTNYHSAFSMCTFRYYDINFKKYQQVNNIALFNKLLDLLSGSVSVNLGGMLGIKCGI